jgi:error-prone DNA polymerase
VSFDSFRYAELHAHSNFSFLDGVSDPEDLVQEAARLGLSALALTDHNGFYGIVKFATAARALGLPAIYGAELTVGSTLPRQSVSDPPGEHLVVLAKNPQGYRTLSRLISQGHADGGVKGRFDMNAEAIAKVACGNLIVLTGCRKGPISRALVDQGPAAAHRRLLQYVDLFGRDDLVVECWDHGDPLDIARNEVLTSLAVRERLVAVGTGNVHYATPSAGRLASIVAGIRSGLTLDEIDGYLLGSQSAYLRSPQEQARRFARFPGLVEESVAIAECCAFDLQLVSPRLPNFQGPDGLSEIDLLRRLVSEGAERRYGPPVRERVAGAYTQLDHELEVIEQLEFAGYFLVVWDIVEFCRRQDIFCQGRGSAANSAVCFALGITNCDPVALGLLFERFLSPERDGPPDIDIDIESGRREEVLQYVFSTYTRERAAQVANVITYRSRSALREVGKALGYSSTMVDRWSKHVERYGSLEKALQLREPDGTLVAQVPEIVGLYAQELEHSPRHLGLHSGGMVICDRPVIEVCPTEWARHSNRTVVQWDKEDCAAIGLVKFDLLGLGMLTAIHEAVSLIEQWYKVVIDIALLPQEDEVYEMLCQADSVGVFQVESRAQMATLPRLKPRHFYDLVVEVALIRPGPIQGGSVHPYIRRRNGLEAVTYLHPLLEKSLAKTLGVPLFQEQLMQMAIDVAGFTPAEADQLRQAMGSKRSKAKMQRLKERFYTGMERHGIVGATADAIFDKMAAFANFGFPESHSASFAYLVYVSSWLKLYYPAAMCAALLRAQPMGFWSPNTLIGDARRHGVTVLRPQLGRSLVGASLECRHTGQVDLRSADPEEEECRCYLQPLSSQLLNQKGLTRYGAHGPAVRIGIEQIRGIGRELAQRIVDRAPYEDLTDLVERGELTQTHVTSLARAGALEELSGHTRRQTMWMAGPLTEHRGRGLIGLPHREPPRLPNLNRTERYALDLFSSGVIVDGHPMEVVRQALSDLGVSSSEMLNEVESGALIEVGGIVTHRQRPHTAKGVTFINLEDEWGLMNVICSKGVWARYRRVAREASGLVVRGQIEKVDGVVNILARELVALETVVGVHARNFR